MERIFLCLLSLSGWSVSSCQPRQFHYVAEPLNWTEAQTYCRQKYTDLATIESLEEMKQFNKTVLLSGLNSEVWIGLYRKMYRWSDGYTGDGAEYRKWAVNQPDNVAGNEPCTVLYKGGFYDTMSSRINSFFCYRGSQQDPEFVFVRQLESCFTAQRICREGYADLATVKNDEELQKIESMRPSGQRPWIGLYREPHDYWSDGSSSEFRYLDNKDNSFTRNIMCGAVDPENSEKLRFLFCERSLPFVCYSVRKPGIRRQIIRLKIRPDDPSVDPNNPGVKDDILKKLQDKLKERGLDGVTLKWREQPDGKVFHREGESSEEERKKRKSEL